MVMTLWMHDDIPVARVLLDGQDLADAGGESTPKRSLAVASKSAIISLVSDWIDEMTERERAACDR
jgi:hypothetical protein